MRALFSGRWQDNWLLDLIVGGLKETNKGFPKELVEVIYDGSEESRRAADLAGARHNVTAAPIGENCQPQIVFVCHDDLPRDMDELDNIMSYLEAGVPVYHMRHMDRQTVNRLRSARRIAKSGPKVKPAGGRPRRGGTGAAGRVAKRQG